MSANKMAVLITAGLLAVVALLVFGFRQTGSSGKIVQSQDLSILKTWKLPADLNEVSGIVLLDDARLAAVQDEQGIIFIYNLETSRLEQQVSFAGSGDYEGIAVDGSTAYVLESDGTIHRVENFLDEPVVQKFSTEFSSKNNLEGLFYDGDGLLLAVKEKDPFSEDYKGIYRVALPQMKLKKQPVYKMTFQDSIFERIRTEKVQETFFPSEVARHPGNGNLLVLTAETPRLLRLDSQGKPISLLDLDPEKFPQPEGLGFDSAGNIYISNEGNPATIHKISLKN